jgi:hypothetical protein
MAGRTGCGCGSALTHDPDAGCHKYLFTRTSNPTGIHRQKRVKIPHLIFLEIFLQDYFPDAGSRISGRRNAGFFSFPRAPACYRQCCLIQQDRFSKQTLPNSG